MKTPALVAVEAEEREFEALFAAARRRGVRVGWLELAGASALPAPWAERAAAGPAKHLTVGAEGSVAVKPRRGAPVLRDLLREHFVGFELVLVRGHAGAPRLVPQAEEFRLETAGGAPRSLAAEALLDELLRPGHRA